MSKTLLKIVTIILLAGVVIFAIPLAIIVNLILLLDSYFTQLYREYNRRK